jgi:hypothetical protein
MTSEITRDDFNGTSRKMKHSFMKIGVSGMLWSHEFHSFSAHRTPSFEAFDNPTSKHLRLDRMLRLTPNPRPVLVKHKRHRRHQRAQTSHDRQSVRHSQVLVERRGDDHHAARSNVSDHGNRCERAGGVNFVGVDDVLVTGDGEAWLVFCVSSGIKGGGR